SRPPCQKFRARTRTSTALSLAGERRRLFQLDRIGFTRATIKASINATLGGPPRRLHNAPFRPPVPPRPRDRYASPRFHPESKHILQDAKRARRNVTRFRRHNPQSDRSRKPIAHVRDRPADAPGSRVGHLRLPQIAAPGRARDAASTG